MTKPTTRDGYLPEQLEQVRATCLYVATFLGDLRDDLVVIGGLVPSLIIDQGTSRPSRRTSWSRPAKKATAAAGSDTSSATSPR